MTDMILSLIHIFAANAGLEGSVIIDKIMSGSDANYGFDAQKEVYLSLIHI